MVRMDKYGEEKDTSLSRTKKNENLYKDVYLNNTLIDFNKIMDDDIEELNDELEEIIEIKTIEFKEKEYDINKYLEEKRSLKVKDNLPRSLDEKIKENDNEINELISKIEQKEKEEDLFNELMPDNEDTTLIEGNNELNNYVSDTVINNYVMNKDMDETNSFMDLDETKIIEAKKEKKKEKKSKKKKKNNKDLAIVIFSSTAIVLVGLIIYIVIKIF